MAQCSCNLPANQTCPAACSSCVIQSASCTCSTPCTFLNAACSSGYTEISEVQNGCAFGFVTATCRRTGFFQTSQCATCAPGRWGSTCQPCPGGASNPCNGRGTCSEGIAGNGTCGCFTGYAGAACDQCAPGYFGYPNCVFCSAQSTCSNHGTCGPTGACVCAPGFAGTACDQCAPSYFGYPNCTFCNASATCNNHGTCGPTGACACAPPFAGTACDQCAAGYFDYPNCVFCNAATTCSGHGTCGPTGACVCDPGFSGVNCLACEGVDGDGDAYGSCDCDDSDPQAWATPGEVRDLVLTTPGGPTNLAWSPPLAPGGNPLVYTTLRFDDPRDFDGIGFCVASANPNDTTSTDPDTPAIGRAFFYLVRAISACPNGTGPLGASSSGDPRTGTCH